MSGLTSLLYPTHKEIEDAKQKRDKQLVSNFTGAYNKRTMIQWEVDITKFDNKTQQYVHVTTLKGLRRKDARAIVKRIHSEDNSYSASAKEVHDT